MLTESSAQLFEFAAVDRRAVVAGFDGGAITSDAGALLLGAADPAIGLVDRLAGCFIDPLGNARLALLSPSDGLRMLLEYGPNPECDAGHCD